MTGSGRLVYSTDGGTACGRCGRARDRCTCRAADERQGAGGPVRVGRETQGRRGKGVTVVTNLPLRGEALEDLARELKRLCGSGGTVRDDGLEIQGDHRERIVRALEARGWTVKRSGG